MSPCRATCQLSVSWGIFLIGWNAITGKSWPWKFSLIELRWHLRPFVNIDIHWLMPDGVCGRRLRHKYKQLHWASLNDALYTSTHGINLVFPEYSAVWFNIKMSSYQYRKSHCWDKTVVRSSYLHNGISYTGKMSSLYWISTQSQKYTV